jgi:hypothetical protein
MTAIDVWIAQPASMRWNEKGNNLCEYQLTEHYRVLPATNEVHVMDSTTSTDLCSLRETGEWRKTGRSSQECLQFLSNPIHETAIHGWPRPLLQWVADYSVEYLWCRMLCFDLICGVQWIGMFSVGWGIPTTEPSGWNTTIEMTIEFDALLPTTNMDLVTRLSTMSVLEFGRRMACSFSVDACWHSIGRALGFLPPFTFSDLDSVVGSICHTPLIKNHTRYTDGIYHPQWDLGQLESTGGSYPWNGRWLVLKSAEPLWPYVRQEWDQLSDMLKQPQK